MPARGRPFCLRGRRPAPAGTPRSEHYDQIRAGAATVRRFPIVARPREAAGQKVSDIVRAGGEQVTDKVADAGKERLFGAPASKPATGDGELATAPTRH